MKMRLDGRTLQAKGTQEGKGRGKGVWEGEAEGPGRV